MDLDTVRCNIRPFLVEDIDAFMAYRNDMDWMKYQGFKGLTKQEYTKALLNRWNTACNHLQANKHFDWGSLSKTRRRYMLGRLYDHSAKNSLRICLRSGLCCHMFS